MPNQIQGRFIEIESRIAAWALERRDVIAAMVVGSRARRQTPADEFSDLDIVLVVDDPALFLDSDSWLPEIAPYWLTFLEPTADGSGTERRTLFVDGVDVDFVPVPTAAVRRMASEGFPEEVASLLSRGFRVLFDKTGVLTGLPAPEPAPVVAAFPSQPEFINLIADFYYHVAWSAKKLARGETWMAKSNADCYQKRLLRRMLEWQAQATHGPGYETWHDGRFLDNWAGPEAVRCLKECFAHYDPEEIKRAIRNTSALFGKTARDVARKRGYEYCWDGIERTIAWLEGEGLI